MDVMRMLSVAGYAWNFDCVQPPLVVNILTREFPFHMVLQNGLLVGQKGVGSGG